jgi:hypothetical protein
MNGRLTGVLAESQAAAPVAGWRAVPARYLLVLLGSIALAFLVRLRTDGIFACPADGYGTSGYLAYCQASDYGEYDRGAFWYGLQPEARRHAAAADVLFLGSSRMQFGFSTPATSEWFAAARADHFLLGFSHDENVRFTEPLLARLGPRPRAYVINVERFFEGQLTLPARAILQDDDAPRYWKKWLWQRVHAPACTAVPVLCGNQVSFFRETRHGAWRLNRAFGSQYATDVDDATSRMAVSPADVDRARRFLATLPVDQRCIVLTLVPSQETHRAEAADLAAAVGLELVSPTLTGLRTFDSRHLDLPSAERWSRAFYAAAGPRLRSCLGTT